MDFVSGSQAGRVPQTYRGANAVWVAGGTGNVDAQAGMSAEVAVQFGLGAVLSNDHVDAAIVIKVGEGGTALFAIDFDSRLLARNSREVSVAIAAEP